METILEFVDSRGASLRVDRERGIIAGVKVLGLESRNGRTYLPESLARAVRLYEGAKVNVNHPKGNPSGPRDYQDRLGVRFASDGVSDVTKQRGRLEASRTPEQVAELRRQAAVFAAPVADPRTQPIEAFKTTGDVIKQWTEFLGRANRQVTAKLEQAHRLLMEAKSLESDAMRFLTETADLAIASEIQELVRQVQDLERAIRSRAQLVNVEASINEQRREIDALLAGERRRDTEKRVSDGKENLRALMAMRPGVADVVAANEKATKDIAALQARIGELRREQLIQ